MGERSFAFKTITNGGVPQCAGEVIQADGELRGYDFVIPSHNLYGSANREECAEVWNEVPEDAAAVYWEWQHGRYRFTVAHYPKVATSEMLNTAKRLYQEAVSAHADDIDWADMCLWRHNPTGAPGWNLEVKPVPSSDELRAMVEAANARLAAIPGVPYARPHAIIHDSNDGWNLCIEGDFGRCETGPLLGSRVEEFLQQERDYLCHVAVVQERQHRREVFAPQYEAYRSVIEKHGGQLLNVGADGFYVTIGSEARIYALDSTDFRAFRGLL